jgi:hypothetical protein
LAAGDISKKLPFLISGNCSPSLIPINTKPLIFYLLEFYRAFENCRIHIFVSANQLETVRTEISAFEKICSLYPLPGTRGVNHSLKMAVNMVPKAEETVINLVTTIPIIMPKLNEVQVSKNITQYKICSNIIPLKKGTMFVPKSMPQKKTGHPFTGIFRVKTTDLQYALDRTEIDDDLLYVVMNLAQITSLQYKKVDWKDCGHEINYYETKSKLISARTFNEITVSLDKGILRKTSRHVDKLQDEYHYIKSLPREIQVYFPRIITDFHKENTGKGFFEMEFYGYPNLVEYRLYWKLDSAHWYRIFSRLQDVLKELKKQKGTISRNAFAEIYLEKTHRRFKNFYGQLKKAGEDTSWLDREIFVNNVKCQPLDSLWDLLEKKIISLYHPGDFCIIHGDFCFNNILYDMPSGMLRFVDPRGNFGNTGTTIYGDQKYDLAKLAHSALGGYDYFVNELFAIEREGYHFHYRLNLRENNELITDLCLETVKNLGYRVNDIQFIMGLLFVSMCSLHKESRQRQQALFIHGLSILNNSLFPEMN